MKGLRLLIVEDEDSTLEYMKRALQRKFPKAIVDEADGGKKAIELIRANDYDLVILDIMMPEVNGKDVMKTIKQEKKLPDILVVTAYDSKSVADEVMAAGAVDYLPKPIPPNALQKKVELILRKRGKLQE
jgi:DNA-binding response OmpR family regulator